jgi:pimeloyl-ACP methyl ester carboxylesterase
MPANNLIKTRVIKNVNGLNFFIRETFSEKKSSNTIVLLHGFPELSYSYRFLMILLSKQGYYCIAPDQRGYGKTQSIKKEKINNFSVVNLAKDVFELLKRLKINKYHIIGHDFGSYVSSYIALFYPKYILSLTIMSMPFGGPIRKANINKLANINKELKGLEPKRKHYQYYFSSKRAASNIINCRQGLKNFLRNYFYFKSYDYPNNKPFKLDSYSATSLAKMPEYYIMNYSLGMAQTVLKFSPSQNEIDNCKWLTDADLLIYYNSFKLRGIQEPLNWYKVMLSEREQKKLINFKLPSVIEIPSLFIAGSADWGVYQKPGELEKMESLFFSNYAGTKIIKKAGHWVQQEQPKETFKEIISFLYKNI